MAGTNISFYLKTNQILIFTDALREIGSPDRICFLMDQTGENLILAPYGKRDLKSHRVPPDVYTGKASMIVCSLKLCQILASRFGWINPYSYRVPGHINAEKKLIVFNLSDAIQIEQKIKK